MAFHIALIRSFFVAEARMSACFALARKYHFLFGSTIGSRAVFNKPSHILPRECQSPPAIPTAIYTVQ
jgi:hypothetical protein